MIRVKYGDERGLEMEVRRLEAELERYRNDDSDAAREFHAMRAEHAVAIRRAEEAGYERGLKDGRSDAVAGSQR